MVSKVQLAGDIASEILESYCQGAAHPGGCRADPGPPILLAALSQTEAAVEELAGAVLTRWLDEIPGTLPGVGAFAGLGGLIAGLAATRAVSPIAVRMSAVLLSTLEARLKAVQWRIRDVAWADYDLFFGPAGLILGAQLMPESAPVVAKARNHLALMARDPSLDSFRAGVEIHPRSLFNIGAINTGLGHGVAGVALALVQVIRSDGGTDAERVGLRNIADWLHREAFVDRRGLPTWPPIGAEGGVRYVSGFTNRQAWCYGTPGLAWAVFEASDVLGDEELREFAVDAIERYCKLFDPGLYIDPSPLSATFGVCHGAAGIFAVVDAFGRYADLAGCTEVRDGLFEFIIESFPSIQTLAQTNMTLLDGAAGVLATLLASEGQRSWMGILSLR